MASSHSLSPTAVVTGNTEHDTDPFNALCAVANCMRLGTKVKNKIKYVEKCGNVFNNNQHNQTFFMFIKVLLIRIHFYLAITTSEQLCLINYLDN